MIAGFSGALLSEEFVESLLADRARDPVAVELQTRLKRWQLAAQSIGPASSLRSLIDISARPLTSALGLAQSGPPAFDEDHALLEYRAADVRVLLVVVPWGSSMSRFWRVTVVEARRRNAMWAVVFNGTQLRLLRPSHLHSRRHVEVDLGIGADDVRTAEAIGLLFGSQGLGGAPGASEGLSQLIAQAERHASGVRRSLRTGVLDASTHVLRAMLATERGRPLTDVFEQSLTIVYRLLFLLFAEARALVPVWHPVYRDSYSVASLRDAALSSECAGLWDGLRAAARLAHAGCQAGGLKVTAFNGRLFSPTRTPLAERRGLDDREARDAILAVSTRTARDGEGREPISYRDLGVEQLGAVYETLLDYTPHVERGADGRVRQVSLRSGSGIRKATGTFYTPQPLVDYLVRDTVGPLVAGTPPEQILALRVLDPSMGSGAFLVGACRFLSEAYESALVEFGRCHASDVGPREQASIRRLIAERCLFGVDVNPTAVQLARLSLWLTTLAADRPLTFLDHHLRVGDSLAGTWLSRLRAAPVKRRAASLLPLFADDLASDAVRDALPVRVELARRPNETAAQVRAKERALATLSAPESPLARWMRVADLWCANWLASPPVPAVAFSELSNAALGASCSLPDAVVSSLLARVDDTSRSRHLFHWELEFPEAFFDEQGQRRPDAGFDAVLGNPPWDMVRADGDGDRLEAKRDASALVRFARDSGVYDVRSEGHVNRYQLFVERAVALARPGGRIGLVLPSGMIADAGSAALRRMLFTRCAVERIVGFDNRSGTFPIHRSVKFILLSAAAGRPTREIACRFGQTDPGVLHDATTADGQPAADWFHTRLTPTLLGHISGEDFSIPDLRSPVDLAIVERAHHLFPRLGGPDGWQAHFGRELNATEDRPSFRDGGRGVPVLEGKLIEPFKCDIERSRWRIDAATAERLLGARWRRARLAYRDVASPTNRLTLIAAILPADTVTTHTLFCLKEPLSIRSQRLLAALFNSLVVNHLVRLRVGTHVTTAIVERLPIPREDQIGPWADALADASVALATRHRPDIVARLNAIVAHLYQLREDEFDHVLERFPLIDRTERDLMRAAFNVV